MNKFFFSLFAIIFFGSYIDALGTTSLVAHWSMNENNYDGNYVDTVGGYTAKPTGEPNFITGVRDEPKGAVIITSSTGWGLTETFAFDPLTGLTICFWSKWNPDQEEPVQVGDLVVNSVNPPLSVINGIKANQRWQHVCVTYDGSMGRVYLNGQLKSYGSWELPTTSKINIEIGNTNGQKILNGAIDDIRLYNFALSQTEITQLVTGEENCTQQYSLEYDFSGPYDLPDCMVNLYDLAEFSKYWLENCTPEYSLEYDFSGPYGLPDCTVNLYDLAEFSEHWLSSGL